MPQIELAGLRARVTGGDGPTVVLLHGFGAPGDDLVPLARVLDVPREVRFVFPAAPLDLGPEYGGGRAWWWIDMMERQLAMMRGESIDFAEQAPPGMDEARDKIVAFLERLDARPLVLGGFSQGSMVALDAVLRGGVRPSGLALMSGTLVNEAAWGPRFGDVAGLPIAQTHGTLDELLPFDGADRLRACLTAAGAKLDFVAFEGGHEIPPPALDAVARLVTAALFP